jgi:hypothetical protein
MADDPVTGTQSASEPAGPRTITEDVRFTGGSASLAGSVVLPRGGGPYPALVLVHDAGDRPAHELRPLAKALAREGIAALIYDKRGVGDSGGDWRAGDFDDLAADALAGVRLLQAHPEINRDQVGLLGLGEGGWPAPLAAARSVEVAFLITIGASGLGPIEQERYRRTRYLRGKGHGKPAITFSTLQWLLACAVRRHMPDRKDAPPSLARYFTRVSAYDPLSVWRQVRQPILALWGEGDDRVPPRGSAWLLRRELRGAGHPDWTATILPDVDHLLRTAGLPESAPSPTIAALAVPWLRIRAEWGDP